MKYASTYINEHGHEIVCVVLPLEAVPDFDPGNPPQQNTYGVSDDVDVGWVRNSGGSFTPYAPPTSIPAAVSMRQARIALHRAGHLAAVQAAIPSFGVEAEIEWEYATEVRRGSPLVAAMAALLAIDDAAMDALFIAASWIP